MGKGAEGGGGGLNLTECLLGGQVRKMLGDFSSVLAILLGCGLDAFLGLATPKLMGPREFKVRAGRGGEREGEEGRGDKSYYIYIFDKWLFKKGLPW